MNFLHLHGEEIFIGTITETLKPCLAQEGGNLQYPDAGEVVSKCGYVSFQD